MCSTAPVKWTMSRWVTYTRVLLLRVAGDASMSSTDCCRKCFLSALSSSRVWPMPSRRTRNDLFCKEIKFLWIRPAVSSSQWILVIWAEPNCQKDWRPYSDPLLSLSLIWNLSVKTCWWPKVSSMPRCWLKSSWPFICSAKIYCLSNSITIGVWELLRVCSSWRVFSKETNPPFLRQPCSWEPWEILTFPKLLSLTWTFSSVF